MNLHLGLTTLIKTHSVASALIAISLLVSSPCFAQGGPAQRQDHREDRRDDRQDNRGDRRDERGAGPDQQFHRGDRLPPQYRGRQYVVDDWRDHHLSAPPRGYHWVQNGGDYLLVAITTGVILNLLLNH